MRMAQLGRLSGLAIFATVVSLIAAKDYSNRCTLHQGGCKYHVVLTGSDCSMVQDGPATQTYADPRVDKIENVIVQETVESVPMKKLEELEHKLVKMMEGLSVRSLRHIRQIRNDLRSMTSTMDLLKHQGGNGKSKRGLGCPPEFIGVGTWSSCYRFSSFNATWHEAREYCSAFGADLVALDTVKESYILDYLIKSKPDFDIPKGWWTSGNYIVRNRKWMWTTKLHLKPMTYSRWAPGEPDARSTMHCMLLYKHAGYRWHDAMCTDRHNFICEIEI